MVGRGGGGELAELLVREPGPFFMDDLGIAPPFLGSEMLEELVLLPDPLAGCWGWKLELALDEDVDRGCLGTEPSGI